MKIDVLTLFPNMFNSPFDQSIIRRALDQGHVSLTMRDFREFGVGKHRIVDDTPYGGGAGMLLKPEPIFEAIDELQEEYPQTKKRIILMDPAGRPFDHQVAQEFSEEEHLVFICGHYEGYDERIRTLVTDEVSLGDYVLTGGELAAMVMIDATVRLLPEVLGNVESARDDSHASGLLEHPHYTRPAVYREMEVPEVLRNGNHQLIDKWRHRESLRRTFERRPDLLERYPLTEEDQEILKEIIKNTEK